MARSPQDKVSLLAIGALVLLAFSILWSSLVKLATGIYTYRQDPTLWLTLVVLFELGIVAVLWRLIQSL